MEEALEGLVAEEPEQARKKPGRKVKEESEKTPVVEMDEQRRSEIVDEVLEVEEDIDDPHNAWASTDDYMVLINRKLKPMSEVVDWIKSKIRLPEDMTTADVRSMELSLGNLMQLISADVIRAQYSRERWTEVRKNYFADVGDKKRTQAVLEAELRRNNQEYAYISTQVFKAQQNAVFWESVQKMIASTLDRLKQVSITLSLEAKVDGFMNQNVPNKSGEKF